jgi:hypothetical protein
VIFGVEEMMPRLEEKFESELAKGSKVIACRFPLPNRKAAKVIVDEGVDTVWIYEF